MTDPGPDAELEAFIAPDVTLPVTPGSVADATGYVRRTVDVELPPFTDQPPLPEGSTADATKWEQAQYAQKHADNDPALELQNGQLVDTTWHNHSQVDPNRNLRPQVQCHHDANGTDTDEAGHQWNPPPDGDCPSSPHAYVPELPEAQRSQRLELPPVPENHVAVELDFSLGEDEDVATALQEDKGVWAFGCDLELVQENGPAGGAAVVRLSGPPESVKGALIRYCGGDTAEAAHLYGPGFTEHTATVTPGNS